MNQTTEFSITTKLLTSNQRNTLVSEPSFDIIGNKLADDDDSADKVEIQNLNGKTLKRGQKIYYQVWLDTRDFTAEKQIFKTVGITDNYEER